MPRKSETPKVVPLDGGATRLRPPASLNDSERDLFASLVASNKPNHFQKSDLPLLCQYAQAAILSERAAAELRTNPVINGKPSPWLAIFEKSSRACIALSMRLRLSPQARAPNTKTVRDGNSSVYEALRLSRDED